MRWMLILAALALSSCSDAQPKETAGQRIEEIEAAVGDQADEIKKLTSRVDDLEHENDALKTRLQEDEERLHLAN